jgi:hypothetical protein
MPQTILYRAPSTSNPSVRRLTTSFCRRAADGEEGGSEGLLRVLTLPSRSSLPLLPSGIDVGRQCSVVFCWRCHQDLGVVGSSLMPRTSWRTFFYVNRDAVLVVHGAGSKWAIRHGAALNVENNPTWEGVAPGVSQHLNQLRSARFAWPPLRALLAVPLAGRARRRRGTGKLASRRCGKVVDVRPELDGLVVGVRTGDVKASVRLELEDAGFDTTHGVAVSHSHQVREVFYRLNVGHVLVISF